MQDMYTVYTVDVYGYFYVDTFALVDGGWRSVDVQEYEIQ